MKHEIKEIFVHPDFIHIDLRGFLESMTSEEFEEFRECYVNASNQAMRDPFAPGTELEFELAGWNRRDFFSVKRPPRKTHPDKRFVYQYNRDNKSFYKLAIGNRNAKGVGGDSIYFTAKHRPKSLWIKE